MKESPLNDNFFVMMLMLILSAVLILLTLGMFAQQNDQIRSIQPEIVSEAKVIIDENTGQDTKFFKFTPSGNYPILSDAKNQINDYAEKRGWVSAPINQDDESYIVFHRKE